MEDYIIKAILDNGQARAYVSTTKGIVTDATKRHNLSPVAAVALGRLLTGGAMMGTMQKNDNDLITIRIKGNGPIGQLLVTADPKGNVKGYVTNPNVMLPLKDGRIDVAGALGIGVLSVTKDLGMREPYVGDCILVTSEIGDDLTYYFATSEQTPSAVGLGVSMDKDNTSNAAGGFIVQMMPGADEVTTGTIEANIAPITSVSGLLLEGKTPEDLLDIIFKGLDYKIVEKVPTSFHCNCSRKKVTEALLSLGADEIQSLIDEDKPVETTCQFCGDKFEFSLDELKIMEQGLRTKENERKKADQLIEDTLKEEQ